MSHELAKDTIVRIISTVVPRKQAQEIVNCAETHYNNSGAVEGEVEAEIALFNQTFHRAPTDEEKEAIRERILLVGLAHSLLVWMAYDSHLENVSLNLDQLTRVFLMVEAVVPQLDLHQLLSDTETLINQKTRRLKTWD